MATDPTMPSGIRAAEVPAGMLVSCPLHQSLMHIATACNGCEHFAGIAVMNKDERFGWEQQHILLCRYRRKLQIQRVGEAPVAAIGSRIGVG